VKVPIGASESARLEFKAADAMKHPESVIRAVVAMLNSDGGEIWVGLGEENGKAVSVQPLSDAERARVVLRDKMVELIEPTPVGLVDPVVVGGIIAIKVRRGSDRPFALKSGNSRDYLGRFGDRTRALSYEELREAFSANRNESSEALSEARKQVGKLRARSDRGLVLIAVPLPEARVSTNDSATGRTVEKLMRDHLVTGSRRMGWTFHYENAKVDFLRHELVARVGLDDQVIMTPRGEVVFMTSPNRLIWSGSRGPSPERDVHPIVLCELVTSAIRILKELSGPSLFERQPKQWLLHLALLGMHGWTLVGGSPLLWSVTARAGVLEEDEYAGPDVLFERAELEKEPDRIALTLLKQLYADFGLTSDQIPPEFDQEAGVLRLSD
jgi:hypothetical protein